MKTKLNFLPAGSIVTCLAIAPVFSIEPAIDQTRPPSSLLDLNDSERTIERPTPPSLEKAEQAGKIPFIGISTGEVPEMLADHLGQKAQSGVIVRTVLPNSPAKIAGLVVNDIILKVDNTFIHSPAQFSKVIRSLEVGAEIGLTSIHEGSEKEYVVTLVERPAELASRNQQPLPNLRLNGLSNPQADRIRDMIQQKMDQFGENPSLAHPGILEDPFSNMREQMNRAFEDIPDVPQLEQNDGQINFQRNSTVSMMDSEGSVEIQSHNDQTKVTVRDHAGMIQWSGPWNTSEEKAKAPDDIKERINRVNTSKTKGFSFRFGSGRPFGSHSDIIEN